MTHTSINKYAFFLSLLGVIGGLLMFAGDMFFYYEPVSGIDFNSLEMMIKRDNHTLMIGGALGPVAAVFYAFGALIFYFAFTDKLRIYGKIISLSWIFMLVLGGAYHSVFPNFGFVGKLPVDMRGEYIQNVSALIDMMSNMAFVLGLISSLLLAFVILFKKTIFPKWFVLLIPTFLTLLNGVIEPYIPSPFGAIIIGGWVNLCFVMFFSACAILFYKNNKQNT